MVTISTKNTIATPTPVTFMTFEYGPSKPFIGNLGCVMFIIDVNLNLVAWIAVKEERLGHLIESIICIEIEAESVGAPSK